MHAFSFGWLRTLIAYGAQALANERGLASAGLAIVSLAGTTTLLASMAATDGAFSFDQIHELVHSSVARTGASLEVRGSVVVTASGTPLQVEKIQVPLSVFGTGAPVRLGHASTTDTSTGRLVISYRDATLFNPDVPYTATRVTGDGNDLLEPGETFLIVIRAADLALDGLTPVLTPNARWTLELTSPIGGVMDVTRTLPYALQPVMGLP